MMHRNQKEYILSRDSHWLLISLSISAGIVGGNTFVSFTEFVHRFGISAMWVFVGIASGILLINLFKHNLAGLQDRSNVSISDYTPTFQNYSKRWNPTHVKKTYQIFNRLIARHR